MAMHRVWSSAVHAVRPVVQGLLVLQIVPAMHSLPGGEVQPGATATATQCVRSSAPHTVLAVLQGLPSLQMSPSIQSGGGWAGQFSRWVSATQNDWSSTSQRVRPVTQGLPVLQTRLSIHSDPEPPQPDKNRRAHIIQVAEILTVG